MAVAAPFALVPSLAEARHTRHFDLFFQTRGSALTAVISEMVDFFNNTFDTIHHNYHCSGALSPSDFVLSLLVGRLPHVRGSLDAFQAGRRSAGRVAVQFCALELCQRAVSAVCSQ